MIKQSELKAVCEESLALIEGSGIPINDADREKITAADFGLSRIREEGKEEIIRAISGDLYFYVEGEDNMTKGFIPEGKESVYTLRHEIDLKPGDQLIFPPDTPHWFQAGPKGAVMFSFSTKVVDNMDGFTDPAIQRETVIVEG